MFGVSSEPLSYRRDEGFIDLKDRKHRYIRYRYDSEKIHRWSDSQTDDGTATTHGNTGNE
jgi:hypothetical protein